MSEILTTAKTQVVGFREAVEYSHIVETYVQRIIKEEDELRTPSLFKKDRPGQVSFTSRNTLTTVVYHSSDPVDSIFSQEEQEAISRYLFAQYINPLVGRSGPFFDHTVAYENKLYMENISTFFHPGDIHALIGTYDGQIMGYLGIEGPIGTGTSFGDYESRESLYYVEQLYGSSVYDAYSSILNCNIEGVREMRRFVARQNRTELPENIRRLIAIELAVALINVAEQFKDQVKIIIGDIEPSVAGKHLGGVLGIPHIYVENAARNLSRLSHPYDTLLIPRYDGKEVVPFAFATKDVLNGPTTRKRFLETYLQKDVVKAIKQAVKFLRESLNGLPESSLLKSQI